MKKAISLLLLIATLLGCCSGIISCNGNKDSDDDTIEATKLNYSSEPIVDFNDASLITGNGLTVTTDTVKTAANGGMWDTGKSTTATIEFSKTDLSGYKEISVWINNTSDKKVVVKFSLSSDDKSTAESDSYGVRINVHPGWHQYTLPFSELTQEHKNLKPNAVETTGTPLGLNSISGLTLESRSSGSATLVIDTVYAKTQKYGTFFGQDYSNLEKAVCFYEDSNAYLYDQLRYVLHESDTDIAVKADSDTTYIPVAILAEHRGATNITASAEKVSFNYNGTDYEFTPDKAIEYVGVSTGKQPGRSVSSKPIVKDTYLMIPMEKCAEIFGYQLYYDKTGLVIFSDIKNIYPSSDIAADFDMLFELIDVIAFTNYSGAELLANMDELYPEGGTSVMMNDADFARLKKLLETDTTYASWFKAFEANYAVGTQNYNNNSYRYNLSDGYRLLETSRATMSALIPYAFLYKMTDNPDYAEKCSRVMLQIIKFEDKDVTGCASWHPEHFLDTAEIMYGFSIAYNWCYDAFTDANRKKFEDAVWELGFGAALGFSDIYKFWNDAEAVAEMKVAYKEKYGKDYDGYTIKKAPYQTLVEGVPESYVFDFDRYNWTNNWNGVCNGGMVTMALAFANVYREEAEYLLDCCMYTIPASLAESYGPDGGYPESPGYWSYGTNYSIHSMQSLESACGTNLGYINSPGFRESFYFINYVSSPANGQWSYHDTGAGMPDMARFFWFAEKCDDADIGKLYYDAILEGRSGVDVWALMWYDPDNISDSVTLSLDQCYYGIDTATFRSDWTTSAIYAGIHGGANSASHGNHDIGNFILEMGGVRFFTDLGSDEYNLKNEKYTSGVLYFTNPYRFWLYRERAEGSNTLVINPMKVDITNKSTGNQYSATVKNYDQNHSADSQIYKFFSGETSAYGIVEMHQAYSADIMSGTTAYRGLYLTENRSTVVIQDEMTLSKNKNEVYWMGHLITGCDVKISDDKKTAIVTYEGLSMVCSIVVPDGYKGNFEFRTMAADYLPVTGLTSAAGELSRAGMQKLVVYSNDCPQELQLAVVCRLLNDGPHNYVWTPMDEWTID